MMTDDDALAGLTGWVSCGARPLAAGCRGGERSVRLRGIHRGDPNTSEPLAPNSSSLILHPTPWIDCPTTLNPQPWHPQSKKTRP